MNVAAHILLALLAYAAGSFPTAYVFIRRASGKDLRSEGTGNIGAMNAFEVSRSRSLGLLGLLVDLL
jgi:acyl phosphate:glycerol-3-phosphate acyltransferase